LDKSVTTVSNVNECGRKYGGITKISVDYRRQPTKKMDIHGSNVHIQLSSNIQIFIIYPM
jgi:hypothetical protein